MPDPFLYYDPVKGRSSGQCRERPCDACRRMKVKCKPAILANIPRINPLGDADAQCERCTKRGTLCSFQDPPLVPKRTKKQKLNNSAINQTVGNSPVSPESIEPSTPVLFPGSLHGIDWPQWENDDTINQTSIVPESEDLFGEAVMDGDAADSTNTYERILTNSDLRRGVSEFTESGFLILPVVDKDELYKLLSEGYLHDPESHNILHAICMLNSIGRTQMNPTDENRSSMRILIATVERMRLSYDYVERPTLNTVAISLFLFAGYTTALKQNRSFLYLQEAISLFELIDTSYMSASELRRRSLIQKVLYVSEAATISLHYPNQRPRASPPSDVGDSTTTINEELFCSGSDLDLNNIAGNHATQLCTSYSQTNLSALMSDTSNSDSTRLNLYLHHNKYVRIVTADAVITQQWRLSVELLRLFTAKTAQTSLPLSSSTTSSSRKSPPVPLSTITAIIQHISRCITTPISILPASDLRLVSLAKLPSLAQNIYAMSEVVGGTVNPACQLLLSGLITVIVRGDIECAFVPSILALLDTGNCGAAINTFPFQMENGEQRVAEGQRHATEREKSTFNISGANLQENLCPNPVSSAQDSTSTQGSWLPVQQLQSLSESALYSPDREGIGIDLESYLSSRDNQESNPFQNWNRLIEEYTYDR